MNLGFWNSLKTKGIPSNLRLSTLQYWQKVENLVGISNVLSYYPLWETVGGTSATKDIVGGYDGTPTGAELTLGASGAGDGRTAYQFGGAENYINPFTAAWGNAWNGNEYTVSAWVTVDNWTDGGLHRAVYIGNGANTIVISKPTTNNQVGVISQIGGVTRSATLFAATSGWFHLGIVGSQSGNKVSGYFNGLPMSGSDSHNGSFVPNTFRIGTQALGAPYSSWLGKIAHILILKKAATDFEMRQLATITTPPHCTSFLGDSITSSALSYKNEVAAGYSVRGGYIDHSVVGYSVVNNMSTIVSTAINDNADKIIIALGTNDNNAGDMGALQTAYENGIASLKISNPNATIYALNVLPVWTDNTGAVEVDKANIRTAIAAACASQGVACWDTYTVPWIAANQTSDGMHPTTAGHSAIATQILARL